MIAMVRFATVSIVNIPSGICWSIISENSSSPSSNIVFHIIVTVILEETQVNLILLLALKGTNKDTSYWFRSKMIYMEYLIQQR